MQVRGGSGPGVDPLATQHDSENGRMVARHPFVGHRAGEVIEERRREGDRGRAQRLSPHLHAGRAQLRHPPHGVGLRSRSRHASRSPVAENRGARGPRLWLTVVVGLAVGWWGDRNRLEAPLAKLAEYERAEQIALKTQTGWKSGSGFRVEARCLQVSHSTWPRTRRQQTSGRSSPRRTLN